MFFTLALVYRSQIEWNMKVKIEISDHSNPFNGSPRFAKSMKLWLLFKRILSVWKSTSLQSGTRKTASVGMPSPTSTKKAISLCVCVCERVI